MRKIAVSMLAVTLLAGCAIGSYIKQIPIIESNGSKSYVLTNPSVKFRKDSALQEMKDRAEKLCPSGYNLINEEIYAVALSAHNPPTDPSIEVVWQIKCKNPAS